jgi:nickel transport protein
MAVEATYHDGSPMAFCDVEVFRPSGEEPYQTGTTDSHGRFAFVPNTTGSWSVAVDDGMGHRAIAEVVVDTQEIQLSQTHTHDGGIDTTGRLVLGLSAILALFGLISLVYARRRRAG